MRNQITLYLFLLVSGLFAVQASAQTIRPKRIVVLSRYTEAIQAAKKQFEAKYGANLIEVETGENEIAVGVLERADVIVFHYLGGAVFEKYEAPVKAAARGAIVMSLPGDNAERFWGLKSDARLLARAEKYWESGGAENLTSFLAMMYLAAGGRLQAEVAEAQTQATSGIYHPRSKEPFATLTDYLKWYRGQKIVAANAPLAGILFYNNNYKFRDLAHVDALVRRLEKERCGQTAPPPDEADQTAEESTELPTIREEVTVTATRGELETEKSPVSASVVTLQENRSRNVQTVDQSLNLLSGVNVLRTKGNSDNLTRVQMRNFNGQERTLVLLDGQPINDAYSGGVSWSRLPLNEVDRVEVARGPFSSLYGGSAMGGVINILTRPIDRRSIELSGQYGTYDSNNYAGRYSDLFFGKLDVSVSYQRLQTGGYNTRSIALAPTTGTTGTLVTRIIPSSTTQGARNFIVADAGDNWYNQHAYRGKFEYKFTIKSKTMNSTIRGAGD